MDDNININKFGKEDKIAMESNWEKGRETVRNRAIEWQTHIFPEENFTMEEFYRITEHFARAGKMFNLTEEFKDNGVI